MQPSEVLFVTGDVDRLASIKIRGREIAQRLGCHLFAQAKSVASIPGGYKAFICIKPDFPRSDLPELAKRGAVVWDILDDAPPTEGVDTYIASTVFVKNLFMHLRRPVAVIPHYHCNFNGHFNDGQKRSAAYVGSEHWCPKLDGIRHERYFVSRWQREQLVSVYMNIGISINLRSLTVEGDKWVTCPSDITPVPTRHIMLNSGIKLINCLGFGLPSVSSVEPAYMEIAPECTLFTDQLACAQHIDELENNSSLYALFRARCISESRRFSVTAITEQYRQLVAQL